VVLTVAVTALLALLMQYARIRPQAAPAPSGALSASEAAGGEAPTRGVPSSGANGHSTPAVQPPALRAHVDERAAAADVRVVPEAAATDCGGRRDGLKMRVRCMAAFMLVRCLAFVGVCSALLAGDQMDGTVAYGSARTESVRDGWRFQVTPDARRGRALSLLLALSTDLQGLLSFLLFGWEPETCALLTRARAACVRGSGALAHTVCCLPRDAPVDTDEAVRGGVGGDDPSARSAKLGPFDGVTDLGAAGLELHGYQPVPL
jgi:hypothetical protein